MQVRRDPANWARLQYLVALDNKAGAVVEQESMLHFPGIGFDGLRSPSVIGYAARQAVSIGLAAEEHAGRVYSNGVTAQFAISYDKELKQPEVDALRERWAQHYAGGHNSGKPLVLTNGADIKALSLTPGDMQLLDARKFQIEDIARAFGVPPHLLGMTEKTTSWGQGIAEQNRGLARYTLMPWSTRVEQRLSQRLPRGQESWPNTAPSPPSRRLGATCFRHSRCGRCRWDALVHLLAWRGPSPRPTK